MRRTVPILLGALAVLVFLNFESQSVSRQRREVGERSDPGVVTAQIGTARLPAQARNGSNNYDHRNENAAVERNAAQQVLTEDQDPDLPPGVRIDKETYLRLRSEYIWRLRGWEPERPFDP